MLANHTSGLPRLPDNLEQYLKDSTNPYKYYTKDALFSYLKTYKAKGGSGVGRIYDYSNLGAGLLGLILEKVSGENYDKMLQDIICAPLHMPSTSVHMPKGKEQLVAKVYNEQGIETPIWEMACMQGAGAIKSNMHDMLLYAKAQLSCHLGPLENAIKLSHITTYNEEPKIGLGWHKLEIKGQEILWHNGGTYGSSSYIGIDADKNIAVVVLANSAISADEVGTNILASMIK
jgi:CubicO group peptidase (beta-lactamase class C family)